MGQMFLGEDVDQVLCCFKRSMSHVVSYSVWDLGFAE
jgi:hypothetical protein